MTDQQIDIVYEYFGIKKNTIKVRYQNWLAAKELIECVHLLESKIRDLDALEHELGNVFDDTVQPNGTMIFIHKVKSLYEDKIRLLMEMLEPL